MILIPFPISPLLYKSETIQRSHCKERIATEGTHRSVRCFINIQHDNEVRDCHAPFSRSQ